MRDLKRLRRAHAEQLAASGLSGRERRQAMADFVFAHLKEHWDEVADGLREGIAFGAVGSVGRGDAVLRPTSTW
ncbi:MAG: hypothetical protein ACLGHM_10515 [Actinomycetes bacterium]